MAEKKTAAKGYQKFKADLAAGTLGEVYIFCGEESYLREYYLKEVQKKLVPAGFEEFNFHRVAGKGLTMEELTEMTEAMPMMAERTLIVVTDCDLYKLGEEQRTRLIALLDDFPEYCCLIFVYDLVEYKPNKTYKKLYAALSDKAQEVRFEPQDKSDLINWIARRFRATGHDIDARTAEHLMFTCGSLMTGLVLVSSMMKNPAVSVENIANGGQMTTAAFAQIPYIGPLILMVSIITFAYSTILGWSYYGERAAEYLLGKKAILPYKVLFIAVVVCAPVLALDLVWTIADVLNAFMAIPNLIAVLLLSGVIAAETKHYLKHLDEKDESEIPVVDR